MLISEALSDGVRHSVSSHTESSDRRDVGEVTGSNPVSPTKLMKGFVYILQSKKNGRYYIGSTNDLERRFEEHVEGIVEATRNLRPLFLVFRQAYKTLREARQVEWKLKSFKRKDIIDRIVAEKEILIKGD